MSAQEIVFEVTCTSGKWPAATGASFRNEPPLGLFFPEGEDCHQINCGQSEGQVFINNCEWGFYWNSPETLDMVVHYEQLSREEAERIATKICAALGKRLAAEFAYRFRQQPRTLVA